MMLRSTRMLGILYVLKAIHAEHISMLKINKYASVLDLVPF